MSQNVRQRRPQPQQQTQIQNGDVKHGSIEGQDQEFVVRESPLTVLIDTSLHIKAIYHIFVVILLVMFCDTVIYDLVESGKVNVGLSTVKHGFGDIRRGAKLWLFEFAIAMLFYPGMLVYSAGAKLFKKIPGLNVIWTGIGLAGVVALEVAILAVPTWDLGRTHLALGSSVAVTTEMFRLAMKICAVAVACAPRYHGDSTPLPTLSQYVYFLFAPTFVYRDQYPRTKKIRWGVVVFHLLEVAAIIFYDSFLWERFILPYWSDYGKQPKIEAGTVVRGMFACVLPGVISFLCGFYMLLHAWLNACAEILTFGDRLFYEDWWTKSQFSQYYRAWNRVVHCWLRDHIYRPLAPRTGRACATFAVFLVSAAAHEMILSLSFGYFYPVLLMEFGVVGMLMVPLTATIGRRFPSCFNLLMWLSFFIGNGILWSLYPMEYFARKNCPPSDTDSYFVPKSWSCPEIVLKPNWTFQNPF
ncbi:sterol O-acyltransferase 1 [Pectinophora gossypiella]|uniref:sterol O-acyltransferase 1 n=1 Tax=Pectinophora gossypiella TaxID=13191 RepID=UPI00214E8034|nr:sterol O-acyltransferase 1 [Pectinophora gossypiella]XP_049867070.1 sterol O-acyltransferase 1 [Pectinophora gossypiella]